jgi:signal peptide peptidase SppA
MNLVDFLRSPWAIIPDRLLDIQAIYAQHLSGPKIDIEAIEARLGRPLANDQQEYRMEDGGVAVLSISGVISNKANMFTRVSGGASAQLLTQQLASMRADPRVRAVVLDFDTPGGSVFGIPAMAAEIRALASEKPTVSVSTGMMASAGYWTGSASNAVYISGETDYVGSIGVVATHSYNPRNPGAQVTEITAGKYKRMASDNAPLDNDGRAYIQSQVDEIYRAFVASVAENRRASVDDVLEKMADGRIFIGQQAIDAGLADGIATVETMVERMATDPEKYASRRKAVFAVGAVTEPAGAAGDVVEPEVDDEPVPPVASQPDPKGPAMTPQELAANFAAENAEAAALIRAQGAEAERARIQAVREQSMPGHEKLIDALAFDGKTTGPEAAVQVLAAERAKAAAQAAVRADDAVLPVKTEAAESADADPKPAAEKTASQTVAAAATIADKAKELVREAHADGRYLSTTEAVAKAKQALQAA